MKLKEAHIQMIRKNFVAMQTKEDFLVLLNSVKGILYGEKSIPFEARHLNYHVHPKHNRNRYRLFQVQKKTGGERTICAPCRGLKEIQFCLNMIIQALYTPHANAFGFIHDKSIVGNAKNHVGNIYIYNIDLKDFFPSIDQARIWGRLQHHPFNLNKASERINIANMIASLCCHEMEVERLNESGNWETVTKNVLPQGAPTSPILTNIICERLDYLLTAVAKRFGLRYSRYADDITFSSMHNVYQKDSEFINELERIVKEQGFTIKQSKTRLQKTGYRQEVTGLIVSDRVNVQQRYVKQLRKWLYYWETYGYEQTYSYFLPKYMADKSHVKKGKPDMANVLSGKLEFLKMVKGSENPTYLKLKARFDELCPGSTFISSILDIWERDGIEKAMEVYYKKTATPKDISEENPADESTPRKAKFLDTYTIEQFKEIESCEEIKVYKNNEGRYKCFSFINLKEEKEKFYPFSDKLDFEVGKTQKDDVRISKILGRDGDILYIMHKKPVTNKKT